MPDKIVRLTNAAYFANSYFFLQTTNSQMLVWINICRFILSWYEIKNLSSCIIATSIVALCYRILFDSEVKDASFVNSARWLDHCWWYSCWGWLNSFPCQIYLVVLFSSKGFASTATATAALVGWALLTGKIKHLPTLFFVFSRAWQALALHMLIILPSVSKKAFRIVRILQLDVKKYEIIDILHQWIKHFKIQILFDTLKNDPHLLW